MGVSATTETHLFKEREHPESDHVLPEVITNLQDESSWSLYKNGRVHVGHLQPLRLLQTPKCQASVCTRKRNINTIRLIFVRLEDGVGCEISLLSACLFGGHDLAFVGSQVP